MGTGWWSEQVSFPLLRKFCQKSSTGASRLIDLPVSGIARIFDSAGGNQGASLFTGTADTCKSIYKN